MTVYDVNATQLIQKAAESLKSTIKMPDWAAYVKTGHGKERVPSNLDWWYVRAAAVLRKVYLNSPIGTNQLSVLFGNKKNKGVKPERTVSGSRKIIRTILQQLEKVELIKHGQKGVHKGRIVTPKGKSFLDKIASQMQSLKPKQEIKAAEAAKEIIEIKQEQKAVKAQEQPNVQP